MLSKEEIEKDTKRCNELIKAEHSNWIGISNQQAIETVLQALEDYQKENTILKVAKEETEELLENSIPKQIIEEKMKETTKRYNEIHTKHLRDCGIAEQRTLAQKEVLQELLEGR